MSKKLEGQVAVVTGASKGIGAAIAEHLAAAGAAVVVNYATSKTGAEAVVGRIGQAGGKAVAVQADVSKIEDVRRLFAEAKKAFGKLDILVNNAGIYEFAPLEAISAEHFHKHFDLNVLGLLLTTQEAARPRRWARAPAFVVAGLCQPAADGGRSRRAPRMPPSQATLWGRCLDDQDGTAYGSGGQSATTRSTTKDGPA
jgi:NAD(P)-dependent dehydrogenase (short-subunit alcohol dehydrogenase family)